VWRCLPGYSKLPTRREKIERGVLPALKPEDLVEVAGPPALSGYGESSGREWLGDTTKGKNEPKRQ